MSLCSAFRQRRARVLAESVEITWSYVCDDVEATASS
jgi:hypothetical protein